MMRNIAILLIALMLLGGCAHVPLPEAQPFQAHLATPESDTVHSCAKLLLQTRRTIAAAGITDSEAAPVPGYPYLRVNRFLSDFRHEVEGTAFTAWVNHMQELAMQGLQVELANLQASDRQILKHQVQDSFLSGMSLVDALLHCSQLLRDEDLDTTAERDALRVRAIAPDAYNTWQRIVGLYPLTALAFRTGINRLHKDTLQRYAKPLSSLPIQVELVRYGPVTAAGTLSEAELADLIKQASDNTLGIPAPSSPVRLFDNFAPVFEIDVVTNDDRIGAPVLDATGAPQVNTDRPVVYRHLSHTRLGKQVLLQLNYTIWFPSRPRTSGFDLLGGHMDGITWRVTLLPDGRPWVYDSMHNCGCYHLFFPTQHARVLPRKASFDEPALMPQSGLTVNPRDRLVIRIAHGTHYIERLYFTSEQADNAIEYDFNDARQLRSLPVAEGKRKSLFGVDGIIASSARGERFLYWPMGIPSPGSMRQWGHHATAFVGRRHFDDAHLLENLFEVATP
jgi:hypothetical protein